MLIKFLISVNIFFIHTKNCQKKKKNEKKGGQFLRAYVERCNKPRVYNLITYGAQHNGKYNTL